MERVKTLRVVGGCTLTEFIGQPSRSVDHHRSPAKSQVAYSSPSSNEPLTRQPWLHQPGRFCDASEMLTPAPVMSLGHGGGRAILVECSKDDIRGAKRMRTSGVEGGIPWQPE